MDIDRTRLRYLRDGSVRTVRSPLVIASFALSTSALVAPLFAFAQSAAPAAVTSAPASPAPASASSAPSSAPEAGGVAAAQEHLGRALVHFREHRYLEAIHEFELANAAAPSADFWYNIARCHELLSHYDEAVDYYQRYLRDKVDPPDRAQVQQHITELHRLAEIARAASRRQTAQAAIRFELATPTPGASLYISDRVVGHGTLTTPFTVAPGSYPIRVSAAGMQDWRATVRVRQGQTVTAFVGLQPATQYETRSGRHLASYIIGAAAIVALGTGIAFGAIAATSAPCLGDPNTMIADAMCDRRDWSTRADILYGVSAGLMISTAIVYFIEAGSARTERVTPRRTAQGFFRHLWW